MSEFDGWVQMLSILKKIILCHSISAAYIKREGGHQGESGPAELPH